jgi:4-amino-4-deoxy-L-arabinose transferase-like glycosyltransferase
MIKMERKIITPIVILAIISIFIYFLPVMLGGPIPKAFDAVSFITTADNLIEKQSLIMDGGLNKEFDTKNFNPTTTKYNPIRKVNIQQYPPGFSILLAAFGLIGISYYFVSAIMGVIGIILLYNIINMKYGKKHAIITSLIAMTAPIYWYWTGYVMADISSIVLFLLSWFLLEKYLLNNKTHYLYLSFAISFFNVMLKYTNVFYLLPLAILFILNRKSKLMKMKKEIITVIIIGILFASLFMYINNSLFGSPFKVGYRAFEENGLEQQTGSLFTLIRLMIQPEPFIKHALRFTIQSSFAMPFTTLGFLGLIFLFKKDKKTMIFLLSIIILFALFYFNIPEIVFGGSAYDLNTRGSYLRYLMPVFIALIVPIPFLLEKLFRHRRS